MLIWVRVALISRVDRAVAGLAGMLRAVGHEPVGALTTALGGSRYGADSLAGITGSVRDGFDVVVAGSPSRIAPLLAALDADVAISAAFPMLMFERMFALLGSLLPDALARVERRDPGDPQPHAQATYAGFFEPEYAEVDWSQTAAEVRRQVLAWGVAAMRPGAPGALTTLSGDRVRVLRVRGDDAAGGTRVDCADAPLWIVEAEPA